MTSGVFKTVPIDLIWVDRLKRQRQELTGIDELADSIKRNGLINPPVIRQTGELVAGERRWTACRQLGWTSIPVQYIEDLPEHEIQQVELEENVRRTDLPWPDQCRAVHAYHALRKQQDPAWTIPATAAALGFGTNWVDQRLAVAKELDKANVASQDKFSKAANVVKRMTERKRSADLAALSEAIEDAPEVPLLNVDFRDWQAAYDGPKFNLIHCDFPYGIGHDKHDQGASHAGTYSDDKDVYMELLTALGEAMRNVVDDSAHLIFWFSMDFYAYTLDWLTEMGWNVDPFPLVWFKSDNTGILPDPNRGPRRVYETAFFARRGDRKVVQAISNCFAAPVTKEYHMSEKNRSMLNHFFRMVCDEYSTVLDPTCGSGNALVAAHGRKASRVLGLERDHEFFARASDNWKANAGPTAPGDGGG